MKKFITVITLCLVALFSCTKRFDAEENESTVTFVVNAFSDCGPITRAFTDSDIAELVEETLPAFYNLKAVNLSNGNEYDFNTTSPITIPNGTYEITIKEYNEKNKAVRWDSKKQYWNDNLGHRCDDEFAYRQDVGWVILCNSPRIWSKDTVAIEKSGNITLNGRFGSSAIVWDSEIIDKIQIIETGNDGIFDMRCFVKKNNLCITFHDNTNNTPTADMILPKMGSDYEKRSLKIPGVLKQGYWYLIEPYKVINSNNEFGITVGSFVSGGDL